MMEKNGEGFIDRSKVRILLCDNDAKSSLEVFTLLCKCSYQVTSVRSPRQVIDALNVEGREIDIILSEVDLPMSKGSKMLKYIMRDKQLRRIPVIMMSARDEVPIVVKCLKLGAADYLVKPLRINELLNLWTHMWRRRRMLGLAEKNLLNYDFDLVISDPSDANTNSTTLFSDDTDDRSWKNVDPDTCVSNHQEVKTNAATATAPVETSARASVEYQPDVPGIGNWQTGVGHFLGRISLFPKKSELKIAESSAFFTYMKSSMPKSNIQEAVSNNEVMSQHLRVDEKLNRAGEQVDNDTQQHANRDSQENHVQGNDYPSNASVPDSFSAERSYTPPSSLEISRGNSKEFTQVHLHQRSEVHHDLPGVHTHTCHPYYFSGVMDQVMMASSAIYQKNMRDLHNHLNSTLLPQFNHMTHCPPHVPGMTSFPHYPVGICLQPERVPAAHPWPSYQSTSPVDGKGNNDDRREAALRKFRQKRKERCFNKKVRYDNRKQLAEHRPRVRGQFVRKVNGVNVDLNGKPASVDDNDEEEDDNEE